MAFLIDYILRIISHVSTFHFQVSTCLTVDTFEQVTGKICQCSSLPDATHLSVLALFELTDVFSVLEGNRRLWLVPYGF